MNKENLPSSEAIILNFDPFLARLIDISRKGYQLFQDTPQFFQIDYKRAYWFANGERLAILSHLISDWNLEELANNSNFSPKQGISRDAWNELLRFKGLIKGCYLKDSDFGAKNFVTVYLSDFFKRIDLATEAFAYNQNPPKSSLEILRAATDIFLEYSSGCFLTKETQPQYQLLNNLSQDFLNWGGKEKGLREKLPFIPGSIWVGHEECIAYYRGIW